MPAGTPIERELLNITRCVYTLLLCYGAEAHYELQLKCIDYILLKLCCLKETVLQMCIWTASLACSLTVFHCALSITFECEHCLSSSGRILPI